MSLLRRVFAVSICISLIAFSQSAQAQGRPLPPEMLRCEYLIDPIGIDTPRPRLYWVPRHTERGQKQSAYQILVSTRPDVAAGDQWDSGKVISDEFTHVIYGGKPLASDKTYYWKVRYWDKDGAVSPYSQIARFDTALLAASDWKAKWVGGANQLRKEFTLSGKPESARAYICGLGYSELRINGKKVGSNVLDPGWTTYDKRVLYTTYDVTGFLQPGKNAVAIMLGRGWYGARALLFQMNIELEEGQQVSVVSDTTWKTKQGPILFDSIYDGEVYDARMETPGWDRPNYDDSDWTVAIEVQPPKGKLSAQMMPAIQVVDTIVPFKVTNVRPGVYVFDMGQNFSGWVQLRVKGPLGTVVRMRFSELVYDDGSINTENLREAKATDVYILRGEGEEVYEPRFTYHGFRYVEVTGLAGAPTADTIRGRVVHTAVRATGGFACSKPLLNQLQRIIVWGQKTNLHSVPTDCDQRNERMGWMGDAHVTAEEAMQNFDMAAFYTNFLRNIKDVQDDEGAITDTVPHKYGRRPADPAWGAAYPLIAWYIYERYGDRRILEEHYDGVKKWVEYLRRRSENNLLNYSYYGDWVAIEKTPGSLVSTFFYGYCTDILAKMAEALDKKDDAENYRTLAAEIKRAFHQKYFDADTNNYANGTQTANALALYLGTTPREKRGAVISNLINDIVYRNNTHVTTGFIGVKYLMELLTQIARSDLAYELVTQTTYPSWGYMIENGATTLWELWQNKTGPSMNSHNHPMFGSVGTWLYQAIAGINLDAKGIGYSRIRIEPQMVRDLNWASGSIETIRGAVACSWSRSDGRVRLEVTIPFGSKAEVYLPKLGMANVIVKEADRIIWQKGAYQAGAGGILQAREERRAIVFEVGSGSYLFELTEQ
jgi:alpha-L-rhamnosidase